MKQQPEDPLEREWHTLAAEALTGMADWRAQHWDMATIPAKMGHLDFEPDIFSTQL